MLNKLYHIDPTNQANTVSLLIWTHLFIKRNSKEIAQTVKNCQFGTGGYQSLVHYLNFAVFLSMCL